MTSPTLKSDEPRPRPAGGGVVFLALAIATATLWIPITVAGRAALLPLAFERAAVLRGEVWRPLTCHLVHLSGSHLLWNLVALAALGVLFGSALSRARWLRAALVSALAASLGVLVFHPEVVAMVGISALLHGLLAAGAVGLLAEGLGPGPGPGPGPGEVTATGRYLGLAALALLALKLLAEQVAGPMPWSGLPASGGLAFGGIAVDAHLYGALGGLAAALPVLFRRPRHHSA